MRAKHRNIILLIWGIGLCICIVFSISVRSSYKSTLNESEVGEFRVADRTLFTDISNESAEAIGEFLYEESELIVVVSGIVDRTASYKCHLTELEVSRVIKGEVPQGEYLFIYEPFYINYQAQSVIANQATFLMKEESEYLLFLKQSTTDGIYVYTGLNKYPSKFPMYNEVSEVGVLGDGSNNYKDYEAYEYVTYNEADLIQYDELKRYVTGEMPLIGIHQKTLYNRGQ